MKLNILYRFVSCLSAAALAIRLCAPCAAQINASPPEQLSIGLGNVAPNGFSSEPASPPNANLLTFTSRASNLVGNDTNGVADVFQYTPERGIELISVSEVTGGFTSPGTSTFGSFDATVSNVLPDGNYAIAFLSDATDLVPGYQSPDSLNPNPRQVYLRLPKLNQTILLSRALADSVIGANDTCEHLSVVALADPTRFTVAFRSGASNLEPNFVPSQPRKTVFMFTVEFLNGSPGIIRREAAGANPGGVQLIADINNPALSGNGDFVVFSSKASFLPNVAPNDREHIWLFERATKSARLISANQGGGLANDDSSNPSVSYRGESVAYVSKATDIVSNPLGKKIAIFHNTRANTSQQVNTSSAGVPSNGDAFSVRVSPGGKLVLLADAGDNLHTSPLPAGLVQSYVKDPSRGALLLVSQTASGEPGNGNSGGLPSTSGFQPVSGLAVGGLGFNSQVFFASFVSAAQNLTQLGVSSDSSPNVFRVSISPPKPILNRNAPIEAPPDVRITSVLPGGKGASVTITMQEFEAPSSSRLTSALTVSAQASKSTRLRYSVEIKNSATKKRITRVTSRNTTTIRRLTPGRYTVRYRVSKTVGKKTTKSRYSPTASLEIT